MFLNISDLEEIFKDVHYCVCQNSGVLAVSEWGSMGTTSKFFHHWHQLFRFEYGGKWCLGDLSELFQKL